MNILLSITRGFLSPAQKYIRSWLFLNVFEFSPITWKFAFNHIILEEILTEILVTIYPLYTTVTMGPQNSVIPANEYTEYI